MLNQVGRTKQTKFVQKNLWICCVAMLLGMFSIKTHAQIELEEHYVAPDETYEIRYPTGWSIDESDPAFVVIGGTTGNGNLALTVFSTNTVAIYGFVAESAREFAQAVAAGVAIIQEDVSPYHLPGRDAASTSVRVNAQQGIAIMIEMANGDYGMMIALGDESTLTAQSKLITEIVSTYNTPGATNTTTTPDPDTLQQDFLEAYDGDWEDAIAELQTLEIISDQGRLVFQEDRAFFTGAGRWLTPLAQEKPATDFVIAGELLFTSANSEEIETCSLLARVGAINNNAVDIYLEVGIDNNNALYYLDHPDPDGDTIFFDVVPLNLDLEVPHHIMYIVSGELLNVYLDGRRYFTDVEISERSGYYGINLLSQSPSSACEGHNIWVYELAGEEAITCQIQPVGTVNQRSGPGTGFDVTGQVTREDVVLAIAQITALDGFRWWQLSDQSWVREDVVETNDDCEFLPVAEEIEQ